MKNTREKDRQTQVLAVFALIRVMMEGDWKTIDQVRRSLKINGYNRCSRTIRRLLKVLDKVGVKVLVNKQTGHAHQYKINKKRPFGTRQ